jgi:hypothetical protein
MVYLAKMKKKKKKKKKKRGGRVFRVGGDCLLARAEQVKCVEQANSDQDVYVLKGAAWH